jgi:hypothetical protein
MKLVLQILLIFVIIATFSICAIKPEMHKNIFVYDSAYTIVSEEDVKTETKEIPVMVKDTTPQEKIVTVKNEVKQIPVTNTVKTQKTQATIKKEIPQPHRSGVSYGIPLITYYPSIAIYFFSGSFSASFFGIESFRTPSSNLAFTSSCFTASPT